MSTAYRREVERFLREDYGVAELTPLNGGNHPRLRFEYAGRTRTITLHRDPSETNALAMKLQDIRRELGKPPTVPTRRQPRKLEDMMPSLPPTLAVVPPPPPDVASFAGTVAVYNDRISLNVPPEIVAAMGGPAMGVAVEAIDDENWAIYQAPGRRRPNFGIDGKIGLGDPALRPAGGTFGISSATYEVRDGVAYVNCPTAIRRPMVVRHKAPPSTSVAVGPEAEMRALLERVRAVETQTPYRLTRVKTDDGTRLAWVAPRIE